MQAKHAVAVLALSLLFFSARAEAKSAPDVSSCAFARDLSFGVRGEDVRCLQQYLNAAGFAVVADGSGSRGHETEYYGARTRDAVARWQGARGVSPAAGYFGGRSRAAFRELSEAAGSWNAASSSSAPPAPQPRGSDAASAGGNPNLVNLDRFLSAVHTVGHEQGMSGETLAGLEKQIRIDVATTTNLRERFIEEASKSAKRISGADRRFTLASLFRDLFSRVSPTVAYAQAGSPFGGQVYFVFYCVCSGTWLITMQPLPPTFAALLTYTIGTQMYMNFNTPFTLELLGFETPGAGQCQIYIGFGCSPLPSQGMITGTVGSS